MKSVDEIIPIYVFDDRFFNGKTSMGFDRVGIHRRRFILESVLDLKAQLIALGSDLLILRGKSEDQIYNVATTVKTSYVFCNRERTRDEVEIQDTLEKRLWTIGQEVRYSRGKMLYYTADLPFPVTHTPDQFATFRKEVGNFVEVRKPHDIPDVIPAWNEAGLESINFPQFNDNIPSVYKGGESRALNRLRDLLKEKSRRSSNANLSPWLSLGCLSPKKLYEDLRGRPQNKHVLDNLVYRDYCRLMAKKHNHLMFTREGLAESAKVNGSTDSDTFEKWKTGKTGQQLIDAIMNELAFTGHINHQSRYLTSRFMIREMGLDWLMGAQYFESILIDYDPCSNYFNWNVAAGVDLHKVDERDINYDLQQKKLDPEGEYVKRWLQDVQHP